MHIAVTLIDTQPGIVNKLLEDTRICVAVILQSGDKKDTATVSHVLFCYGIESSFYVLFSAVIYGANQKIPDQSLICDMTKLYISSWYETDLDMTKDSS